MREPGYPLLLAGLLLLFGKSFAVVKLANMCLALAVAWLMTRIARRLSRNLTVILVPPLLFLFHPGTLIAESRGGVEVLFTFLITLFMLALYRAMENNGSWDYVMAGAVLGLTVLVKSTPILFPLVLLLYLLVFARRQNPKLTICRNISSLILATLIVLSPWIIRNYLLTRHFVPTASVLGVSAHAGQYICVHRQEGVPWVFLDREAAQERGKLAHELGYRFKEDDPYYQVFYSSVDELNFSSYLMKRVMREYQDHPSLCLRCMGYNLFNFWFAGKPWMSTGLSLIVQLPYLILGAAGLVLCARNNQAKVIGPLVLFIVYVVAVYIPILAQARYSVPLIPFLSILATIALVPAQKRFANSGFARLDEGIQ
jgi:4-amino-4-deoxy-L-arabinose transferase-like glycosyltransferase